MTQIPHFNYKPRVAEATFSGIVISTGDKVEHVKAEDYVFGGLGFDVFMKYGGVLAEYIILRGHVVICKPSTIPFEGAGGIGASEITVMQFVEITNLETRRLSLDHRCLGKHRFTCGPGRSSHCCLTTPA